MISSQDDHLSFSIYNHGFDQEEFFVQDVFTLKLWTRALQQHVVDMSMIGDVHSFGKSCFLSNYL